MSKLYVATSSSSIQSITETDQADKPTIPFVPYLASKPITITQGPSYTGNDYTCGVLLPDGRVVLTPYGNALLIYNPATNTFFTGPTPSSGNYYQGGVLLPDGRVFLGVYIGKIGIYNPTTNVLTEGPSVNYNYNLPTLLPDGRVVAAVTGGTAGPIYIYDSTTNTLTYGATSFLSSGLGSGVLLPDGRVVFVPYNHALYIYNPTTNAITTGPTATGGSHKKGILLPDGRVLFTCGGTNTYMEFYNPTTNTLKLGYRHTIDRVGYQGGILLPDGRVMLNASGSAPYNLMLIYDPVTDTAVTIPGSNSNLGLLLLQDGRVFQFGSPGNKSVSIIDGPWTAFDPTYMLSPYLNKF